MYTIYVTNPENKNQNLGNPARINY